MKKILIVALLLLCIGSSLFAAEHYIYLRNSDIEKLIKKINEKAVAGWVVSGGITQAVDSNWYSQDKAQFFYYVLMYDSKLIL